MEAPALLDVEMWGAFHEYKREYVAAVQAVRRVTLVPYCFPCLCRGEPRPRRVDMRAEDPRIEGADLAPVCDEHAADSDEAISPVRLGVLLDVEVAFAAAEDSIVAAIEDQFRIARPKPPMPRAVLRLDDLLPGET